MTLKKAGDQAFLRESAHGTRSETTYAGALSFMRRKYSRELDGVDLVVSGVPLDLATTNRPGARFGPRAIRAASSIMAWARPYGMPFDPFDRLAVVDYGDCMFDFGRPESVPQAIESHAATIIGAGPALLALGGDHFVTWPLLKAHAKRHGAPLSLLHFDAHTDTWSDEDGRIDHGTMLWHAVREGLVDPARSVQIGIRTTNDDTLGFNILDAAWVHERGIDAVVSETRRILGDRPVYLTFDIDCLDPAFAPGTGTPVAGGLSSAQALMALAGLGDVAFVGGDVVEVSPPYDHADITAIAAATVAQHYIGLLATRRRGRE